VKSEKWRKKVGKVEEEVKSEELRVKGGGESEK
jgi:hypothetical protein